MEKEIVLQKNIIISLKNKLNTLYNDCRAVSNFKKEKKIERAEKTINVGFLCQYIPAWNKIKPVYELMKNDPRFQTFLICIPSNIENNHLEGLDNGKNDTLDYFLENGYTEAIDALDENNQWLDLKALNLSYIFYPRPYNNYMPLPYISSEVSKYCKICIILYGINTTKEITSTTLNRDFFRNVFYYFAETEYSVKKNKGNFPLQHFFGLQKTVCFGMPTLQAVMNDNSSDSKAWDFSKNEFRVMWTPRWTTDLNKGGTNFFLYYKSLTHFAEKNSDMDFLFRPHPLAFKNFIKNGDMTEDELERFKSQCESLSNVSLDKEKEYVKAFWGSSVLISDISAMLPEYFVTGKPLIFCASNMILELDDNIKIMMEGCYIVYNEEELFSILLDLKNGQDPLCQKRKELIKTLFGESCRNSKEKIVEELAK